MSRLFVLVCLLCWLMLYVVIVCTLVRFRSSAFFSPNLSMHVEASQPNAVIVGLLGRLWHEKRQAEPRSVRGDASDATTVTEDLDDARV